MADIGADIRTCQSIYGVDICMLGDRLREERKRLGLTQPQLAEIADSAKRTVIDWEKGVSSPTALQLEAMAANQMDVLYVVTGVRANVSSTRHSPHGAIQESRVAYGAAGSTPINAERLVYIVQMIEKNLPHAARRWSAGQMAMIAAEIYNLLADEPALEDSPKLGQVLKLVANR